MINRLPNEPRFGWLKYLLILLVFAAAGYGVMSLYQNIMLRKQEALQTSFAIVKLTEETLDPKEWGKNFPRQYDAYSRTVDVQRTRHGGSEAFQKLESDPLLATIFAGYAFGVDYREERGHAYMLRDQDMTERLKVAKQPGACLQCHASALQAYWDAGVKAGVASDAAHRQEAVLKGFEYVCAMPYAGARKLVQHPVGCVDCHNPETMALRVTRPGFLYGIRALAKSDEAVPHLPSIETWRKGERKEEYDPNRDASRQELRSMACGQCHVEYYFKGEGKLLTYPWKNGLKVEQIEKYYDDEAWADWKHALSGADVLKAQHPEFEMWSQGIHARSGVACADCHMPYIREGAIKISDHHVRSPLLNISRACQQCHNYAEAEIQARAEAIQDRTSKLLARAEAATVDAIHAIQSAAGGGATDELLAAARKLHRQAQWRTDFVAAENSSGFHAPQESARILGEAIDLARQSQLAAVKATGATGAEVTEPAAASSLLKGKEPAGSGGGSPAEDPAPAAGTRSPDAGASDKTRG
ncbi:MAG: ammonia-forming cytochrome c nitrite reductase subunit c552 [Planctomycetaceae bacterium]|nr:ammonia-forming cytochrome c nitrite reductase subunit c552 [Planctomycetaceae bacterium]